MFAQIKKCLIVALFCVSSYAFSAPVTVNQSVYSTAGGYAIEFPSGWEIKDGAALSVDVIAMAPTAGKDQSFHENINVVFEKLPQPMALDQYSKLSVENLKKMISGFKLEKESAVTIEGKNWTKLEYTVTSENGVIKIEQYLTINGNMAYVITCSGDLTDFASMQDDFAYIVRTFTYIKE